VANPPRSAVLSLIVPTRQRIGQLKRLLNSLAATAADLGAVEVVLVVDRDDPASCHFTFEKIPVRLVVVEPGLTMGALNRAGYQASLGTYIMLLNDDVVARTKGWDRKVVHCFRDYPDGILLVHCNDRVFEDRLCTFPVVSRVFCELAGGICPADYVRYRIDDHIEDVFNLLGVLGERRVVYLPGVIFEHLNYVVHPEGVRQYYSDEGILAVDAPRFEALLGMRKELAVRLKEHIAGPDRRVEATEWPELLANVVDSRVLRLPGRQRVVGGRYVRLTGFLKRIERLIGAQMQRARACVRRNGIGGLLAAVWRRLRKKPASALA
jgi:hypothetical protein